MNHEIHQIHEMSGEKRVMFSCASCISWLTKMLQGVFTTAAEYEIIRAGRRGGERQRNASERKQLRWH